MTLVKGLGHTIKRFRCGSSHYLMDPNWVIISKRWFSYLQWSGRYTQKRNIPWDVKLPHCIMENILVPKQYSLCTSRQQSQSAPNDPDLSRNFFVRLWVTDRNKSKPVGKRKSALSSGASVAAKKPPNFVNSDWKPPPATQSDIYEPMSPEEAKVAPLLARSNLLITRDIEWANLVLGFEQENRYAIVDVVYPQSPVGFIREQSNLIARQLLRLRRPFLAYITDGLGNELFRVRRPFWWITSSIYAEINGQEIGVVHRRWHLWRRIYDLYLGNKQFAVVENPGLWNWTFTLKDADGHVLAEIDRDWRGFGFEIFTDAGQYVIRFGKADPSVAPVTVVQELDTSRQLTLSERAIAVALAVSLDNDYFSRHGGWGFPFMVMDD